ncbi:hypothetical protein ACF0H5_018654 [Mactra antiquata]
MWKQVTLESKKKKMKIVSESMTRDAFYDDWMKEMEKFIEHYDIMKTQYQQTRILKESLPEIVIHMDFAENYSYELAFVAGDFIAATYDGTWYISKVLQIDNDEEVEISFMQQRRSLYQWPTHEDVIWVANENLLCKINEPIPHGRSGRMFHLPIDEKLRIASCFDAKNHN